MFQKTQLIAQTETTIGAILLLIPHSGPPLEIVILEIASEFTLGITEKTTILVTQSSVATEFFTRLLNQANAGSLNNHLISGPPFFHAGLAAKMLNLGMLTPST